MSKEKTPWPGIIPTIRRFFYGAPTGPKAKRYSETDTPTTSKYYEGMNEDYRWFRTDELVRRCTVINATVATQTAGFETELEATGNLEKEEKTAIVEKFAYVKEEIDAINRICRMDLTLFTAQVKRSLFGKAGFEIVNREQKRPTGLLPLLSEKLKPRLNKDWELIGFKYKGKNLYEPEDVLYLLNLPLESDQEGLSDVEPIRQICTARHNLLKVQFPKVARRLWAPYVILQVDTAGLSKEAAAAAVQNIADVATAGYSNVINESVTATVVNMTPDIKGLVVMLDKLEQAIIGNFGTPRFLVNKPIENRATAYAELEAYRDGPIAHIQHHLKRELEAKWYYPWAEKILKERSVSWAEGEDPPVLVKHQWNTIRMADIYEMAKAVAALYGPSGMGLLEDNKARAYEMMGFPPDELEEIEEEERKRREEREPPET